MKGYKDKDKKFHPITNHKIRSKRSSAKMQGVKIIKQTNAPDVLQGVEQSFAEQPKRIQRKVKSITIRDKEPDENFIAKIDTTQGELVFNKKPELGEGDYKALGDHEFEHIDFNDHLQKNDPRYEEFVKVGNTIAPFTPSLISTIMERDQAFIDGNFGILPDKRLEYPDEINSVIIEIETRQKLGLPTEVLNEEEFQKAKMLVDNLHKKS